MLHHRRALPAKQHQPHGLPRVESQARPLGSTLLRGERRHVVKPGIQDHSRYAVHPFARMSHGERLLNIRDISALDLPAAQLAYLSACETTRASRNLADEAVHITGAFQLAGFPEVIGTLWSIEDEAALDIATSVYAADGEASGAVSAALRDAVLRLRSRSRAAPSLWAGFVHIGR